MEVLILRMMKISHHLKCKIILVLSGIIIKGEPGCSGKLLFVHSPGWQQSRGHTVIVLKLQLVSLSLFSFCQYILGHFREIHVSLKGLSNFVIHITFQTSSLFLVFLVTNVKRV
uniref:Uncharacterized protein n=1 Tax=Rhizophora mucronata TaxID=61149 RepID=A0A2P2KHJ7_RHIMU